MLRQQLRRGRLSWSEHRRGQQSVEDGEGSRFYALEVAILFSALCGENGRGLNLLVLLKLHGFLCADRYVQAEFRAGQVVAGADECMEAMWIVRGGRGQWREGGGGEAVADTAGGRQACQ